MTRTQRIILAQHRRRRAPSALPDYRGIMRGVRERLALTERNKSEMAYEIAKAVTRVAKERIASCRTPHAKQRELEYLGQQIPAMALWRP